MNELDDYLKYSYQHTGLKVLEDAIRFKFPKIKDLKVIPNPDTEQFKIQFEDDGIHTYDMVDSWLKELRKG